MTIEQFATLWLPILSLFGVLGLGALVNRLRKDFASQAELMAIHESLSRLEKSITVTDHATREASNREVSRLRESLERYEEANARQFQELREMIRKLDTLADTIKDRTAGVEKQLEVYKTYLEGQMRLLQAERQTKGAS